MKTFDESETALIKIFQRKGISSLRKKINFAF